MLLDRYVLYGNHRDSWVHGAIDPSSGTAVMLEITRILGTKLKQGNEDTLAVLPVSVHHVALNVSTHSGILLLHRLS